MCVCEFSAYLLTGESPHLSCQSIQLSENCSAVLVSPPVLPSSLRLDWCSKLMTGITELEASQDAKTLYSSTVKKTAGQLLIGAPFNSEYFPISGEFKVIQ